MLSHFQTFDLDNNGLSLEEYKEVLKMEEEEILWLIWHILIYIVFKSIISYIFYNSLTMEHKNSKS